MAETEIGWTRTVPQVNSVYWWRKTLRLGDGEIIERFRGLFYTERSRFGATESDMEQLGGEWLGPISSSDFEQLTRLREASQSILEVVEDAEAAMNAAEVHCLADLGIALRERRGRLIREANQLREALAPRKEGEQS